MCPSVSSWFGTLGLRFRLQVCLSTAVKIDIFSNKNTNDTNFRKTQLSFRITMKHVNQFLYSVNNVCISAYLHLNRDRFNIIKRFRVRAFWSLHRYTKPLLCPSTHIPPRQLNSLLFHWSIILTPDNLATLQPYEIPTHDHWIWTLYWVNDSTY